MIRKIWENIIFSISVKFLVLGFALAGKTQLWAAIASDVGAMILVTLNSMMLMPVRRGGQSHGATLDTKKIGDVEKGQGAKRSPSFDVKSMAAISWSIFSIDKVSGSLRPILGVSMSSIGLSFRYSSKIR